MKRIFFTIIAIAVVILYIYFLEQKKKEITPSPTPVIVTQALPPILKGGRQCYTYNHQATTTEPYTVNEFIDITIDGTKVTGTKRGTQNGPDMTNGYTGTITGTVDADTITDIFSYIVEGSHNQEKEIYKARADQIGIEKWRYPLVEGKGVLVPDTTKAHTTMLYARVGCTASN